MRGWKGVFAALFMCSWAGNQFSPLLLMYKEVRGYSTIEVNAFLGVYVLGLAPALLLAGALSDRYGRRPVMLAGTVSALLTSAVLELGTFGPTAIYVGRLLAGVTVGTAMAVGTSWLKELSQPPFDAAADAGAGARRASIAFTLGSALGALVAGALAQWGPIPEVLPYLPHLLISVPLLFLIPRIPETCADGDRSLTLRQMLHLPVASDRRFSRVVAVTAPWIFAVAALSYGYVPVLLQQQTAGYGVAYATLLTVVALTVSALIQPVAKRLDSTSSARGLTVALILLTASVASVGVVAALRSPVLGVGSAVLSGAGIGIALSTGLLEVQRIAGQRHLAGLTGLFYALAYLGFLTPTAMAAVAPVFPTGELFIALVVLGIGCLAIVGIHSRKYLPSHATTIGGGVAAPHSSREAA